MDAIFENVGRMVLMRFELFGHEWEISNTLLVMWLVMLLIVVLAYIVTRRLSLDHPSRLQSLVEWMVESINGMCRSSIGHHGKNFAPYIGSLALFLGFSNMIAIFNFIPGLHLYPPTKDINVTAPLALMSIALVLYAGFRYKGFKGWLQYIADPMPLIAPFKLLEYGTKPLSLCMRLLGNIVAAFVIMELIYGFVPLIAGPFSLVFDVGDGLLQAFIFVYLTTVFLGEAIE